jgi:para-aminobenzoate synthetase component 1
MLQKIEYTISDISTFRLKCIEWLKGFDTFCMLDSHAHVNPNHHFGYRDYDFAIAAGVDFSLDSGNTCLEDIDKVKKESKDWLFGFLSYDLKNTIEKLSSDNEDHLGWPDFYFFRPQVLILVQGTRIEISSINIQAQNVIDQIQNISLPRNSKRNKANVKARMTQKGYIENVEQLRKHILRGDIYEVNYCQEFYAHTVLDPFENYQRLNAISPTPFSSFFRLNDKFLISASPERFIKKQGTKIVSQPIKGTAKRGESEVQDQAIIQSLKHDPKEKSENIMIVDLVRNDLSRIARKGSVKVDELCGIYSFSHVHQMISTISAELKTELFSDIIKATFPMGSMTGAPKIRAMKLAEKHECTKRGLYSGAVGYLTPDNNFDFNVVIRSLQYNQQKEYLSYMVGGAITWLSDAEKEYEECKVKAAAIEKLLKG